MTYSFINLAEDVLKKSDRPLTYGQVWEKAQEEGLDKKVNSKGKTPWATLGATISSDILHNPGQSKFCKVGRNPQRYFLKSRINEIGENADLIEMDEGKKEKSTYLEKDLHPLLSYLLYNKPDLLGARKVYTRTIIHQKKKGKKPLTEWQHPDMVGVYFPFDDFEKSVISLGQSLGSDVIQTFSFELKKSIDKRNYREYFFQAVSNSSWANEGYLVVADIKQDDDLKRELRRLTNAFGIGIIHLNVNDIHASEVIFDARHRGKLDWETINKLCDINKDFSAFVERLNTDIGAGQAHITEYDHIIPNPIKYIREELKVKTVE